MGTPDFAVPTLRALLKSEHEVAAVVTQPDRPSGRGRKLTPSPVKLVAEAAGVPVLQPSTLKTPQAVAELAEFQPEVIVVAAFGQILQADVLNLPPKGCINVHASLLPRWRGAAPVAAAIRAGDRETGITIMLMDEGLDTGPILAQRAVPIRPDHTRQSLTAELAEVGAALLLETLSGWLAGTVQPRPQDDRQATLAPRLKKEEGRINWEWPAEEIDRHVRAFYPWPGAFTEGPRGPIKILAVRPAPQVTPPDNLPPGGLFRHQRAVFAVTGSAALELVTVQPPGKKPMSALDLLNGQPDLLAAPLGRQQSSES
ncbi:MAG: methionyl-tRNA formyltransferase [Chloroflexi bacterium]|nr:MAG: methionyl-tRNA formyltransferase [Chloroflexota bacterium]